LDRDLWTKTAPVEGEHLLFSFLTTEDRSERDKPRTAGTETSNDKRHSPFNWNAIAAKSSQPALGDELA
jgi:hypothetical protein